MWRAGMLAGMRHLGACGYNNNVALLWVRLVLVRHVVYCKDACTCSKLR